MNGRVPILSNQPQPSDIDTAGWLTLRPSTPNYNRPVNAEPLPEHIDTAFKLAGWLVGTRLNALVRMSAETASSRFRHRRMLADAEARRAWRALNPPMHVGSGRVR